MKYDWVWAVTRWKWRCFMSVFHSNRNRTYSCGRSPGQPASWRHSEASSMEALPDLTSSETETLHWERSWSQPVLSTSHRCNRCNVIPHLLLDPPSDRFLKDISTKILCIFLISLIREACSLWAHNSNDNRSISLLCKSCVAYSLFPSFPLAPSIFLDTLFSGIFNVCSSLKVIVHGS